MIKLKRAYDPPGSDDGLRILVERLWPRGINKRQARLDFWLRDLAPSPQLRKWYGHRPDRWPLFRKRYWAELDRQRDIMELLGYVARERTVTFVFAARDEERSSAMALKEYLARIRS